MMTPLDGSSYYIAGRGSWMVQVANLLFFGAAISNDQLTVRVLLTLAFVSLLANVVTVALRTGAVAVDALAWLSVTLAIHAVCAARLVRIERKRTQRTQLLQTDETDENADHAAFIR